MGVSVAKEKGDRFEIAFGRGALGDEWDAREQCGAAVLGTAHERAKIVEDEAVGFAAESRVVGVVDDFEIEENLVNVRFNEGAVMVEREVAACFEERLDAACFKGAKEFRNVLHEEGWLAARERYAAARRAEERFVPLYGFEEFVNVKRLADAIERA